MSKTDKYADFKMLEELPYAHIYLAEDNQILLFVYKPEIEVNEEIAQNIIDTSYKYLESYACPYLLSDNSARHVKSSAKARDLLSDNKSLNLVKAHALITKDLPTRLLVNSLIAINKPKIPFKMFDSYSSAKDWLLEGKYSSKL